MTNSQLLRALRARAETMSQIKLARELGVSPTFLNDVLAGRRAPGTKILASMGLRKTVSYRRTT